MNSVSPTSLRLWTVLLSLLVATATYAEESSKVEVPSTKNPYMLAVATLYEQGKTEEALSKLEKALDWKSNGTPELIWLKLMQGVLLVDLGRGTPMASFKEALAMDAGAQLPVKGNRRLRKLFEQARNTAGLPADEEILAEEPEPPPSAPVVTGPPPRRYGLNVSLSGEADALGFGVTTAVAPAVGVGYTREREGGVLTVLAQRSPGLRAEGQFHPLTLGWVRPYVGLGATAFFLEQDAQGATSFFGGVSGRGVLGVDVQFNARMSAFANVAYEHFLKTGDRYRSQSVLFSVGVSMFPLSSK